MCNKPKVMRRPRMRWLVTQYPFVTGFRPIELTELMKSDAIGKVGLDSHARPDQAALEDPPEIGRFSG